ncbi:MAG: SCO family protein [Nitrospirae bacterium]|nr:SCO family protein [Nitrospirota bacterium]
MAVVLAFLLMALPSLSEARSVPLQDAFDPGLLRIDEGRYLGQKVPDVGVITETGPARLSQLIAGKPTILLLAYFTCHGPCPATVQNLAQTVQPLEKEEFAVIVLSFDQRDTPESLEKMKANAGAGASHWTFGLPEQGEIERLTGGLGYKFIFSERDQTFVHPTVLIFLSPQGEVTRYLYGTAPQLRDIRLALIEAKKGEARLSDIGDLALLACYQFDPARSRYALHPALLFGAIGLGLLGVTGLVALMYGRFPKGGKRT